MAAIFHQPFTDCEDVVRLFAWTEEDQAAAIAEGWYIDEEEGIITKDDDHEAFTGTVEAYEHVRQRATVGSLMHLKAIVLDAAGSLRTWSYALDSALHKAGAADVRPFTDEEAIRYVKDCIAGLEGEDRQNALEETIDKLERRGLITRESAQCLRWSHVWAAEA